MSAPESATPELIRAMHAAGWTRNYRGTWMKDGRYMTRAERAAYHRGELPQLEERDDAGIQ